MDGVAQLVAVIPADFDDQVRDEGPILVEGGPQHFEGVAVRVAGMEPGGSLHRGPCGTDAVFERDLPIPEPGGPVDIGGEVGQKVRFIGL